MQPRHGSNGKVDVDEFLAKFFVYTKAHHPSGYKYVEYWGGEPLLYFEYIKAIQAFLKEHNFFANGVLVHNCGEIGMNKDSCRLIAMNLSGYVEKPYTSEAKFNFELFKNHAYKTLKLGDDLVDLELSVFLFSNP